MPRVQVQNSRQLLEVFDRKPVAQLALTSPLLEIAEAARWERRLNGLLDDCGCDAGTVGLLTGLTASLAAVLRGKPLALSPLAAVGVVLATSVGSAVAAKLLGRWRSRRRARHEGRALAGVLRAREIALASPAPTSSVPASRAPRRTP